MLTEETYPHPVMGCMLAKLRPPPIQSDVAASRDPRGQMSVDEDSADLWSHLLCRAVVCGYCDTQWMLKAPSEGLSGALMVPYVPTCNQ